MQKRISFKIKKESDNMSYSVSVPIYNAYIKEQGREELANELEKLDAKRVFIALDSYKLFQNKRQKELDDLKDNCKFFKEKGYEVGAWLWSFTMQENHPFTYMVDWDGVPLHNGGNISPQVCPTDKSFLNFAGDYIENLAKCGVDIILFDDDLRYGDLGYKTPGCLCKNHVAAINEILGKSYKRKEIAELLGNGGNIEVRNAYLKANGNAFKGFARAMRDAVDKVDPDIRIGFCCCMSAWDIDGTNAAELARIFAGKNRPLVRLSGAPYWSANIAKAVEYTRMESVWTRDGDIEILGEGDVFPRPRTRCPAVYLEAYDTALRASGVTDGILKYALDYFSNPNYETGYREFHERNRYLYSEISKYFSGKSSVGVRIYESMKKFADMNYSVPPLQSERCDYLSRSVAGAAFSYCSIPTVYEGSGVCSVAFGENARSIPVDLIKNGLITDAVGAKILMSRGIDVGIKELNGKNHPADTELFLENNNRIYAEGITVYEISLMPKAEILSYTETEDGNIPMSFRYQNANGFKFLVFNFGQLNDQTNVLRHYARSKQIVDSVSWFGRKLPAYSYKNPGLYLQCKSDSKSMTVGAWNCCADPALHPVIELDRSYKSIVFFSGNGHIEENRVYLDEMPAYGFTGFEVR